MDNQLMDKLNAIAIEDTSWKEVAQREAENNDWLSLSAQIAVRVLSALRKGGEIKTQKELAEKLQVSPQYVNKIVKGRENLSLETIVKLEKALNIRLIEISRYAFEMELEVNTNSTTQDKYSTPFKIKAIIDYGNDNEKYAIPA